MAVRINYSVLIMYLVIPYTLIFVQSLSAIHECIDICVQPEDGPDKIHAEDRQTVKNTIVTLMLKSPEQIQKQVCILHL